MVLKSPSTNIFCPMLIVTSGLMPLVFLFFFVLNSELQLLFDVLSLMKSSNDIVFLDELGSCCGLPNELLALVELLLELVPPPESHLGCPTSA